MPRGRKKKFKLNRIVKPEIAKSLTAVVLILFAGLSFVSFFANDYALNKDLQGVLQGSFGFSSILVPFISLLLGLLLIEPIKFKYKSPRVLIGLIGMLLVFAGLSKGGDFGSNLWEFLSDSVSKYGALLILAAGFAVSFILISDVSLDQIFGVFPKIIIGIKGDRAKKKEDKEKITVSSGMPVVQEEPEDKRAEQAAALEPKVEIIPSLAEPQQMHQPSGMPEMGSTSLTSLVNTLPYSDRVWETPPMDLLEETPEVPVDRGNVNERAKVIKATLKSFGIDVEVADIKYGPSVTQYSLDAATGTKISKISALQYDLALALASPTGSVRIEAPIPGKALIGIEVPNNTRVTVHFKSLLSSEPMKALKSKLGIVLGKDVGGQTMVYDIGKMPHILVAGATGSGKSVFLHSVIFSLLYRASPQEVKFILMDPKRTELIHYADIPHLITPVITDVAQAPGAFKWAVNEMERRYKLFESAKARNIESYNEKSGFQALPYVVIVVDELAEIMIVDPASVEKNIIRIAQLARATGIHLVLAVQRPSTNIITGLIKANIPARVAFNVASQIDSRVIIDQPGAEKLLGKGDMLFVPPDAPKPTRLQGAFVTDKEINNLVNFLKSQGVAPEYRPEIYEMADKMERNERSVAAGGDSVDNLFDEAIEIVNSTGKASASLLQRRLSIGYARAARILDELEEKGVIGPAQGSKPREVYGYGTTGGGLEPQEDPPIPENLPDDSSIPEF
jgi:S-DNA-T family DNA segregation ATPase FtsK/SpoIIIE